MMLESSFVLAAEVESWDCCEDMTPLTEGCGCSGLYVLKHNESLNYMFNIMG